MHNQFKVFRSLEVLKLDDSFPAFRSFSYFFHTSIRGQRQKINLVLIQYPRYLWSATFKLKLQDHIKQQTIMTMMRET